MTMKLLCSGLILVCLSTRAATVQISSDLVNESNNRTGVNVFIVPYSGWALAPAGAGWVSYADTGTSGGAVSPPNSTVTPWSVFTENFVLPGTTNFGSLRVWADDTASVLLDGSPVGPAAN